jgi:hypothetical protein
MPVSGKSRARSGGTPGLSKVWILCAALLLGYLFLLCDKAFLSAGGSDSSGYLNAAKLLTRGKLTEAVEPLRRFGLSQEFVHVFIPLVFLRESSPERWFFPIRSACRFTWRPPRSWEAGRARRFG